MTKVVSINLAYDLECGGSLCLLHVLTAPLQNVLNVHLLALSKDDNSGQLLFSLEEWKVSLLLFKVLPEL